MYDRVDDYCRGEQREAGRLHFSDMQRGSTDMGGSVDVRYHEEEIARVYTEGKEDGVCW